MRISSLRAAGRQRARFHENRLFRARAERAAQLRDDAERARMIAAFGDLQIRRRRRRRDQARQEIVLGFGFEVEPHRPLPGLRVLEQLDDARHTRRCRRRRRSPGSAPAVRRRSAARGSPRRSTADRGACAARARGSTSVDSAFAGSMKAHVLTTIASASLASGTSSQPAAPSLPIMTSESTRFFAHPSDTNETRRRLPFDGSGQAV